MTTRKGKLLSYKGKFENKKLVNLTVGDFLSVAKWWLIGVFVLAGCLTVITLLAE